MNDAKPGLAIWPVPTRVEVAEKERLELAREAARASFDQFLGHLPRRERASYWDRIQVPYLPYYAYEEVLAAFADARKTKDSLLASMESLASLLTRPVEVSMPRMADAMRREGLRRFERNSSAALDAPASSTSTVFVSYSHKFEEVVTDVVKELVDAGVRVWMDRLNLRLGDDIARVHRNALEACGVVLFFVGPDTEMSEWQQHELLRSVAAQKVVVPVLIADARLEHLPSALRHIMAARLETPLDRKKFVFDVRNLVTSQANTTTYVIDPDDPQKGRWGGKSHRGGRHLLASVREISNEWYEVQLEVHGADEPLVGDVQFHLHPTFAKPVQAVEAADNVAVLRLRAWGAFTVGAVADGGRTLLELDLAQDERFPQAFRER